MTTHNRNASRFSTVTVGPASFTENTVSLGSGKQLILGGPATEANQAVTFQQLSDLRDAVNTIAGNDLAVDTIRELRTLLEDAQESGVSNLTESINAVSDRLTTEVTDRSNDVSDLQTSISNEEQARIAAVSDLQTSISNEEDARVAADQELSNKIFRPVMVPLSSLVVPDESSPLPMTVATRNAAGLDGWYFKNGGSGSGSGTDEVGGRKINWYFQAPPNASGVATGASLIELDMGVRIINKVSPPFITVYTKLQAQNNAASWYNARYTYIVNDTSSLVNNTNYLFRARIAAGAAVGHFAGFTPVDLTLDTFSSSAGKTLQPTDEILAISIGSDSSSSAGNVEFIQHSLGVYSTNGNTLYLFSNDPVVTRYLKHKLSDVFVSLGQPALLDF